MLEINVFGYVVKPDNGSTWSVSKAYVSKKGEATTSASFYPKSLQKSLERVRDENLKDLEMVATLDEAIAKIAEIDRAFISELRTVLKEAGLKVDDPTK